MKTSRKLPLSHNANTAILAAAITILSGFASVISANSASAQTPSIEVGSESNQPPDGEDSNEFAQLDTALAQRFVSPFYSIERSETLAFMLELQARQRHDRAEANRKESDRRDGHARYNFALSGVTLPQELAEAMTEYLAREQLQPSRANAILAVLLLTQSDSADAAVQPIRALSNQLARIRGERPDPLLVTAISAFVANHADLIRDIDPRHRIGLLEALLEVRDLAGIYTATRGYQGHQLESILQRFAGIVERYEDRYVPSSAVPEELDDPDSEVLKGMHRLDDGTLLWLYD